METQPLSTRRPGSSPQWVVNRVETDGGRATFLLVDLARTGLDRVAVRCAGCAPAGFADHLLLDDGVASFAVDLPGEGVRSLVPPTVTVSWVMRRTGLTGSWSARLR